FSRDWSSDVCSSDLVAAAEPPWPAPGAGHAGVHHAGVGILALGVQRRPPRSAARFHAAVLADDRAGRAALTFLKSPGEQRCPSSPRPAATRASARPSATATAC